MDEARRQRTDALIAATRHERDARSAGYRERALKLFPWICGRCGREFGRERLRELTVHHKDHNHDNNPPDGSNWELLCLYCHDNEHARQLDAESAHAAGMDKDEARRPSTSQPFSGLRDLLKGKQR